MGCIKSTISSVYILEIDSPNLLNTNIDIETSQTYEYCYLIYCTKCDILGFKRKIIHCDICDRCHHISQYLHCTKCNICVDPLSDRDTIRHRKLHKNL